MWSKKGVTNTNGGWFVACPLARRLVVMMTLFRETVCWHARTNPQTVEGSHDAEVDDA